jgi:hypothetical protein
MSPPNQPKANASGRRALVLTRDGPNYLGSVVVADGWVHLTNCVVRNAFGGTPAADKVLARWAVREVRYLDSWERAAA